jgi:hypothetical protein
MRHVLVEGAAIAKTRQLVGGGEALKLRFALAKTHEQIGGLGRPCG